ncbi:hypothetical protein BS78_K285300 [Paspalum vaginatum]|uniref:Uncharacterized protein n=1 Tax=Paspalum vaginatum TaxID=158149 RepID=A0A9W7XAM1_9POAL|nr:hypothetical protein BS78_K285300 [Paspalum vaginatum]
MIMTKDPLIELSVSISPIKQATKRPMNEEPHAEENIDEYKVWLAELIEVYPELRKEYTDDYRQATIKLTNKDEIQDSTPSLTGWPSHARRHKEKANGVCGQGPENVDEEHSKAGGPIGINHRTFVDEVAMYTRGGHHSLVLEAGDVMDNVKESITSDVLKWDLQNTDNPEQKIMDTARERYKGWRGTLSATYKAYSTDADSNEE